MQFRWAVAADTQAVVSLVESAYRGDESRRGWTTEADLLDGQRTDLAEVERLIGTPGARILLAFEPDRLLGSVLMVEEPEVTYVGMLAVRPHLQAHGVGSALLAEAERRSRDELGRAVIRLTVITQRHELIAWYERRGYRRTGASEPFPYGNPRVGLPRRDDLVLDEMKKALPRA